MGTLNKQRILHGGAKIWILSSSYENTKYCFHHEKIKFISSSHRVKLNVFSGAITAVLYPGLAHVLDNHWFIHTRIFEIQTTEFPKNIMLERINCFLTHNSR